mmetsp:Transcript_51678/g.120593  ORF Transcript_51678/g.120593 Transcript_51678/m.120593 type:complete len:402 (-) Transcript_51678:827-2032(-)
MQPAARRDCPWSDRAHHRLLRDLRHRLCRPGDSGTQGRSAPSLQHCGEACAREPLRQGADGTPASHHPHRARHCAQQALRLFQRGRWRIQDVDGRASAVVLLQREDVLRQKSRGPKHLPPCDADPEGPRAGAGLPAATSSHRPQHQASLPRPEPASLRARAGARTHRGAPRGGHQGRAGPGARSAEGGYHRAALHCAHPRSPPHCARPGAHAAPHRPPLPGAHGDRYGSQAPLRLPRWLVQLVPRLVEGEEGMVLRPLPPGLPRHGPRRLAQAHDRPHRDGPQRSRRLRLRCGLLQLDAGLVLQEEDLVLRPREEGLPAVALPPQRGQRHCLAAREAHMVLQEFPAGLPSHHHKPAEVRGPLHSPGPHEHLPRADRLDQAPQIRRARQRLRSRLQPRAGGV